MARISTSSTGGSVNIQDSNGNPVNSSNGSLDVNITGKSGTTLSMYNEVTNISMNASSTILTYTVPPGNTFTMTKVLFSSDSISTFQLNVNGLANAKGRVSYTEYTLSFDYDYLLPSGTTIALMATNNSLQGVASFNVTLQGVLN